MLLLNPFTALSLAVPQSTEVSQAVLNAETWLASVLFELVGEVIISLSLFFFGHELQNYSTTESPIKIFDRTRTVIFNTLAFTRILNSTCYWPAGSRLRTRLVIALIGSYIASTIYHPDSGMTISETAIHLAIVLRGGPAFHVAPISVLEWGYSMALSVMSIPLTFL
jgi:hypothetical protein